MISFTREFRGEIIKCFFNFGEINREISLKEKEKILVGALTIEPDHYLIVKGIK
jgi:trehalose-6-phosphate hydrolase